MSEVNFKSLQQLHENLLRKQQDKSEENQQDFIQEVKEYIERAKQSGGNIHSTRERDQIRANLRYWANYVYSIEKNFPNTELAPSSMLGRQAFWRTNAGRLILLVFGLVALISIGSLIYGGRNVPIDVTETPALTLNVSSTSTSITTSTPESTPTPLFVGSDVVITSPENGESVLPRIKFEGAYTKLKPNTTIHVFLIKSDKLYPIANHYTIMEGNSTGEWELEAALYQNPDELKQAENLAVVPAACFDDSCREILADATLTGIAINELPSPFSFTLYRDSSRVVYRNAYHAIQEMRIVYPYFDGNSYDLYTSKPDGSDLIKLTESPTVYEESPSLSPDGTRIVYVHNTHSIHIMDSNGQNDHEIINGGDNTLENPQWSPDSEYISYALGDSSQSGNTRWSIHIYHISTGRDEVISGESEARTNRYSTWMPDKNIIVFDARIGDRTRFSQTSIDTPGNFSNFFDLGQPNQEVIQPNIRTLDNGYLLTFTLVTPPDFAHNIFAVINSDGQPTFEGTPIRLTSASGGVDYPTLEPNSNFIYYVRLGNIYKVEFSVDENRITLIQGTNIDDDEIYGDFVLETGSVTFNPKFDINFMDAFFPIP